MLTRCRVHVHVQGQVVVVHVQIAVVRVQWRAVTVVCASADAAQSGCSSGCSESLDATCFSSSTNADTAVQRCSAAVAL